MIPKELIPIAVNSSLLEIRTWPKPGNVHKTQNFSSTTYDDFLIAAYKSENTWLDLMNAAENPKINPSSLYVKFLHKSVQQMVRVQSGGNVLLGHFMLMIPLFISAVHCLKNTIRDESAFWKYCSRIIQESTSSDTMNLYQALRIARPGGMGTRKKYDLYNENYRSELLKDNITLEKIFNLSKEYDGISNELVTNYKFIREIVLPQIDLYYKEYGDLSLLSPSQFITQIIQKDIIDISENLNELLLRIYLFIISKKNDTLISRKTNIDQSKMVSKTAYAILEKYSHISKSSWMELVVDFDKDLQKSDGKLNPGTSADLLACSIFLYLVRKGIFN